MAIFTAIGAAVGAIAGAIGAAAAAIGTFIGGLGAVGGFLLRAAVGIGLNYLARKLAGKQDQPRFSIQGRIQAGGIVPRSFILGLTATAGSLVYHNTWGSSGKTPNAYYTRVIALSDLPVKELVQVWVNGEPVTLGATPTSMGYPVLEYRKDGKDHLWIKFYDGTQTQADSFLTGSVASTDRPYQATRVGYGIAYAICTAKIHEELFTGFPEYLFVLDGAKLYDPSQDSAVGGDGSQSWDDPTTWGGDGDHLPAVQLYNLLHGITYNGQWLYGLQSVPAARLPAAAWIAQIEKCREQIQGPGGLEPTYRTGGEIPVSAPIADAIDAILTGCQGRLAEIGGIYKIHVGGPDTPSAAITDDDILSTEEQTFTPFFGLADTVNGIAATYPCPEEGWSQKSAPPLYRPDLEAEAGGRRLMADVALDFVPYSGQVQRLMKSALLEAQRARRHTIALPPKYWTVEPGDFIAWSSERNGYENKLFRVDGVMDRGNLDIIIDITEVDPSDYDWDQAVDYQPPFFAPVGPIRPAPQLVSGWQVQPYIMLDDDNQPRRPSIEVSFDGDEDDVEYVRVQVRLASSEAIIFDATVPYGDPATNPSVKSVVLNGTFLPNTTYEVRGKFVPYSSRPTEWSAWLQVITPNVRLGLVDIDFAGIEAAITDLNDWVGWNTRETIERARRNILLDIEQDAANYRDKQTLRQELASTYETARANWTQAIITATGPGSALALRLEELEVKVDNDVAQAVSLLQTEINDLGQATATAIQQLQSQVGDIASSVTVRADAAASPGGGWSRYGIEIKSGSGGDWSQAAFFMDAQANGQSRVVFVADQFVVTDGSSTSMVPFVISGGVARMNVANIGTVTAGTLQSPDGKFVITLSQGKIEWFD